MENVGPSVLVGLFAAGATYLYSSWIVAATRSCGSSLDADRSPTCTTTVCSTETVVNQPLIRIGSVQLARSECDWDYLQHVVDDRIDDFVQRGSCPPGARPSLKDAGTCAPRPLAPNALDFEVTGSATACGEDVETCACGGWKDAVPTPCSTCSANYRTLSASSFSVDRGWDMVAARVRSTRSFSPSAFARLLWNCDQMVASGRLGSAWSTRQAYRTLVSSYVRTTSIKSVYESMGALASMGCGLEFQASIVRHVGLIRVYFERRTRLPTESRVINALQRVGFENSASKSTWESFKKVHNARARRSCFLDRDNLRKVAMSLLAGMKIGVEEVPTLTDELLLNPDFYQVACMFSHWNASSSYEADLSGGSTRDMLTHFLNVGAATCVVEAASALGAVAFESRSVSAVGRAARTEVGMHDEVPSEDEARRAALVRMEDVSKSSDVACFDAIRMALPDQAEAAALLTFAPLLPHRIEQLMNRLAPILTEVVSRAPFRQVLYDVERVKSALSSVVVVFEGNRVEVLEPKDTFGSTTTNPIVGLLSEWRRSQRERSRSELDRKKACASSVSFDAMETNAYYVSSLNCVVFSVGILRPPFASANYDSVSFLSRIGWIAAHELAHTTILSSWNSDALTQLLTEYTDTTRSEALADVLATVAVCRHMGLNNSWIVVMHVTQLFCAKTNPATRSVGSTHPEPEKGRGRLLCSAIDRLKNLLGLTCEHK